MKPITWQDALKRSTSLARSADRDPELARTLWTATRGQGDFDPDSFAEAVQDTIPAEHAAVLSKGGAANAYAVARHFENGALAEHSSPFERRELAREGWERFIERAKKADAVEYGLGFDESEAWECTREFDTSRDASGVMRIAEMAGRIFAQLSRQKGEQVCSMPEEVHSVELGQNLARLLPAELAHLGMPTETLLIERIANRKAMQYALRGVTEDDVGKGPLVICLDESGSMHGSRGEWSKAAAIALTRIAWQDKRAVSVVHWSDCVEFTELRPGDSRAMLTMIKHWFGGGNNAAIALDNAADEVERLAKAGHKGADVVLVTDGVEAITHKHVAAIDHVERTGARLWTVAVECEIDKGNPLRDRAVAYVPIGRSDVREGEVGAMKGAVL